MMLVRDSNDDSGSRRHPRVVWMNRALTNILLAHTNVESTTPETSNNDWFSRWPTPEVCGACAAPTDSGLATREVVEATRSVTGRYRCNAVGTGRSTYFSYNDLKQGGCFNRTTFEYVPNNGAFLAFKTRLSRRCYSNEAKVTCSGDVDCTEEIKPKQEKQRSDNRPIKTWLYNFLPPIVTTQLGHTDAEPPQENSAEVLDRCLLMPKSRTVSGCSRGRCPSDERHPIVGGRKLRSRLDEPGTARRRQRQPRSAASDDVVHSHGQRGRQMVEVDRRRRRRSSDIPTDDYQVYFTETCLLPHCDCPHHPPQVYSDHLDETALTSRIGENDDDDDDLGDKSDDGSVDDEAADTAVATEDGDGDDDDDDEEEEEETEKKATKSALKSFNSRLNKLKMKQSSEQLQLSLTGHVIDIHSRHEESR